MDSNNRLSDRITDPPRIEQMGKDDVARVAYAAVEDLPFLEMNDGNRLAFHIYLFLRGDIGSIADAIYESKSRISVSAKELEAILKERLEAAGVKPE